MNKKLSNFAAGLRELIHSQIEILDSQFLQLALELFALQFKYNSTYKRICESQKLAPQIVEHWTQIPFVPTSAFKELELTSIEPQNRTAVFYSSGTTEQKPSRHFHCAESLAVYEESLWRWFSKNLSPNFEKSANDKRQSAIFLTPTPKFAPNSSLVHMFEIIRQKFGAPESAFMGKVDSENSWILDFDAVFALLNENSKLKTQNPKLIFGTAFSFVHLLDFLVQKNLKIQLPENSRVMETGGYKNHSRHLPKTELHKLISEFLGIPPENIICEYGMSELSSQAYAVVDGKFQFPSWAKVQIISPETGREVADGEIGLIRIFDLANVFSIAAIQTEDLGIRRGNGFELIGRAQLAEPRGCSLMTA